MPKYHAKLANLNSVNLPNIPRMTRPMGQGKQLIYKPLSVFNIYVQNLFCNFDPKFKTIFGIC